VVTIDIQPELVAHARQLLDAAGYGWVQAHVGDGGHGYPEGAPYDRIILTVGSYVIAPAWRDQLVQGGRLVLPLDVLAGLQHCAAFEKREQALVSVAICNCGFMVLQGMFAPPEPVRTQIGPDPRLGLFTEAGKALPASAESLAGWLSEPGKDRPTGIAVTMPEMWRSFFPWAALQALRKQADTGLAGNLRAMGDLADEAAIPSLFEVAGEFKSKHAVLWIETDGVAALTRPPGPQAPPVDVQHPPDDPPFELHIREFGPAPRAAERLLQQVRDWDQAGRPASARWHIRALPAEADFRLGEGEFVIDKPWTKLVIHYPRPEQK
jgi:protein-L-isoaspartate(D-aspartate) O-methyltransferase